MCCGNDRKEEYFWKFKDGHLDNVCKHCRLKTIDDSKPETFIPLMQMFDIPYIKHEWEWLVQYQREKAITRDHEYVGAFGKYLSKMKLKGFKMYTFADSDKLNEWHKEQEKRYMSDDAKYFTYNLDTGKGMEILPMEEICDMIKYKFERASATNKRIKEENEKLKNGIYEQEEMQRLKEEMKEIKEEYGLGWRMTREEVDKCQEWKEKHEKIHPMELTIIGGRYTYSFTPTSIGIIGTVKCTCGKEFCFREID